MLACRNGRTLKSEEELLSADATPIPTWLRASELPVYYPVFKETTWRGLIRTGQIASRKIGSARIVRTADVEHFLAGPTEPPEH